MNAPWSPEVLLRPADDGQAALALGADGVARWVWQSRFGAMLIEVVDGAVFVNGDRVHPHTADSESELGSGSDLARAAAVGQLGPAAGGPKASGSA